MSTYDLKSLASSGCGMIINSKETSVYDLKTIVSSLNNETFIIIRNSSRLSSSDLKSIADLGKRKVIFDFT